MNLMLLAILTLWLELQAKTNQTAKIICFPHQMRLHPNSPRSLFEALVGPVNRPCPSGARGTRDINDFRDS